MKRVKESIPIPASHERANLSNFVKVGDKRADIQLPAPKAASAKTPIVRIALRTRSHMF
jgi:hypothetical protein